jgi:oligopeptide transport system ATP-binding protein
MTNDDNMLLSVRDLRISFRVDRKNTVEAIKGISFDVPRDATVALVGESGSGKSVSSLAVMGLLPPETTIVQPGSSARFDGRELFDLPPAERRTLCGKDIAMIFQEPMSSLNPAITVGRQIAEPVNLHRKTPWAAAIERARELLALVRIPDAGTRVSAYPHQFSGGMRQRAMIAMALACEPQLIIADEPTTALDVTVQAQILDLLQDLSRQARSALILITHDLGVVARYADRVIVMYGGRVVESAPAAQLYAKPSHPYTRGLMASIPRLDGDTRRRLVPIEGQPPYLAALPPGCAFAPRCRQVQPRCLQERPVLREVGERHQKACFLDD